MGRIREESERTRDQLLAAGERLFLEKGIAAVSLEEIGQAAGFSRGAVHWHFHNKHGLLLALLDRVGFPLHQFVEALHTDTKLDPLAGLVELVTDQFRGLQSQPGRRYITGHLMTFAASEAPERLRDFETQLRAAIIAIFRLAETRGRLLPGGSPEVAGLACFGLISGLINAWLHGDDAFDLANDAARALRLFVDSVSREGAAGGG